MLKKILLSLAPHGFLIGTYCGWEFYGSIGARNLLVAAVTGIFILVLLAFILFLASGQCTPKSENPDPQWLVYTDGAIYSILAAVMLWYGHFVLVGMYATSIFLAYLIHESN